MGNTVGVWRIGFQRLAFQCLAAASVLLACGQAEHGKTGAGSANTGSSTGGSGGSGGSGVSSGGASSGGAATTAGTTSAGGASGTGGQSEAYPIPDDCRADDLLDAGDGCELPVACGDVNVLATCRNDGRCRCDVNGPRDYWLGAVSPRDRCLATASICLAPPEFSDWQCNPIAGDSSPGMYCGAFLDCERSASLAGGVDFTQRQIHAAGCNAREADSWECDCTLSDQSHVRFLTEGDPSCATVVDACVHDRFEREGPRQCALVDSGADEFGCYITRECSQAASFDGASITLREQLLVSCGSLDGPPWQCDCPAGRGTLEVKDEDPSEACLVAEAACLTEAEMQD